MDKTAANNMKSIILRDEMMNRCYLAGSGYAPRPMFNVCCKCGHLVVDEPRENKKAAKQTAQNQKQWLADNEQVQKWRNGEGPPLLDNKKRNVTNVKPPKADPEFIICVISNVS